MDNHQLQKSVLGEVMDTLIKITRSIVERCRQQSPVFTSGLLALVTTLLLFMPHTRAASICYDEQYYPSVDKLEPTATGFVAHLGGKFVSRDENRFDPRFEQPTIVYTRNRGWERGKGVTCRGYGCLSREKKPKIEIPPVTLTREEAVALRPKLKDAREIEQKVSAWTESGGFMWFGIGFYSGEGISGVGGIGKFDPGTKKLETRRPPLIRDSSISPILHDENYLWFGSYGSYECVGSPPVHGLVRYDWETGRIEDFKRKEEGPCGFLVHDLLLETDHLWVATDLGLSRWNRKLDQWHHFVPDPEASLPVRQTTCAQIYTTLLETLPKSPSRNYDFEGPYVQLFDSLARFQPGFLRNYVKAKSPGEWGCPELRFLAHEARDFKMLQEEILSFKQIGSPHFSCILDGFGERGERDPDWRDFLLSIVELPGDGNFHLRLAALPLLKSFSGDEKVGKVIARLLRTAQPGKRPWGDIMYQLQLLPITLGPKSVPLLVEFLDQFKEDIDVLHSIGKALEEATGHYWHPGARSVRLLPENDPHRFSRITFESKDEFILAWKAWWDTHKAEFAEPSRQP